MTDLGDRISPLALAAVLCVDEDGRVSVIREGAPFTTGTAKRRGPSSKTGGLDVLLSDSSWPEETGETSGASGARAFLGDTLAEEIRRALAEAGLGSSALRRDLAQGKVVIIQISPTSYLGLTGYRRQIHTLRIDDCLFLFSPPQLNQARLASLINELAASQKS